MGEESEMNLLSCETTSCPVVVFDADMGGTDCPACGEPGHEMPRETP